MGLYFFSALVRLICGCGQYMVFFFYFSLKLTRCLYIMQLVFGNLLCT